jgi:hypothetical protein
MARQHGICTLEAVVWDFETKIPFGLERCDRWTILAGSQRWTWNPPSIGGLDG